jgi:hypothetical protein
MICLTTVVSLLCGVASLAMDPDLLGGKNRHSIIISSIPGKPALKILVLT